MIVLESLLSVPSVSLINRARAAYSTHLRTALLMFDFRAVWLVLIKETKTVDCSSDVKKRSGSVQCFDVEPLLLWRPTAQRRRRMVPLADQTGGT